MRSGSYRSGHANYVIENMKYWTRDRPPALPKGRSKALNAGYWKNGLKAPSSIFFMPVISLLTCLASAFDFALPPPTDAATSDSLLPSMQNDWQ